MWEHEFGVIEVMAVLAVIVAMIALPFIMVFR